MMYYGQEMTIYGDAGCFKMAQPTFSYPSFIASHLLRVKDQGEVIYRRFLILGALHLSSVLASTNRRHGDILVKVQSCPRNRVARIRIEQSKK